ncbi:class I poly(R)-hydroxyalkanoic acid synthase [Shimia ponticola]|uniref:class I poly(R)-hydroxyalkanoic acid synthase n=1 Tax=Shimia ponticola TaxID=2582893 RepID=UPI0011BFE4DC|nr:class I poly(R)-hydroxyalkanoic acid synthase [Shimia ponticola]
MTTDNHEISPPSKKLKENLQRVDALTKRLIAAVAQKQEPTPQSLQGPSHELFMRAASAYVTEMMANPAKIIEHQVSYWSKSVQHYVEAQQALAQGKLQAPQDDMPFDRRFANPMWDTHPYFNFLKQQYMLNAEAVGQAIQDIEHLEPREKKRVEYFSRQIVDMFSPSNFLGTNPEALERAVETDGESLVRGLENLVADIEANHGDLLVTLADRDAFRVGENLATTPGRVVFQNRLFELIQYDPTTEEVEKPPILVFPPWINKFYILDLKDRNSMIKWLVDQGHTVFVVSWVNPDPSYADVGMLDYVEDGYETAIAEAKKAAKVKKLNVVGYCIAGTTLALTLARRAKRGNTDDINSATFFTTLTDFSDQGEVGVFLNNDFINGIVDECKDKGVLESIYMARTFSYLRSNDLIYGPAIKSYMMGEAPPAFDLLYWNGDSTNLPGKMAIEYLRGLCQDDLFANGGFTLGEDTLYLQEVDVPVCAIACETDHIAAWRSSYYGVQKMSSVDKTFILSESGHIAGIVNPPSKKKYGHYINPDLKRAAEPWKEKADFHDGSWWPRWDAWLQDRNEDGKVKARKPGGSKHDSLPQAPGTYVVAEPDMGSDD